ARTRAGPSPRRGGGGGAAAGRGGGPRRSLARTMHLAGGGKHRILGIDPGDGAPAPAGLLLVKWLLGTALAERDDVHRLEELMIVLAHEAFAAIEHVDLHVLQRQRDLV